jgi:hypothetical protein
MHTIQLTTDNDRLHIMSALHEPLRFIARTCENFVTYEFSLKHPATMGAVVRAWFDSKHEVPRHKTLKEQSKEIAALTQAEAVQICEFLSVCKNFTFEASSRLLWKPYNLTLCLWLYRRLVWQEDPAIKVSKLSPDDFGTLLSKLVDDQYCVSLISKDISSRHDRVDTYKEMRKRFSTALTTHKSLKLPLISCIAGPQKPVSRSNREVLSHA